MPPLHALLFILTLFLLRPAYTATPEQNEQGRIPGSLSGPHTGDWFIDTRCHCIAQNMTTTTKVGHVYQWEYYNFHTNTTFILLSIWDFIAGNGWCRNYPTDPATKENDQLCFYYKWMIDGDWHYVDYMKFNGQMRGLAEEQNQGYTQTPDMQIDENICPQICLDFVEIDLEKEHAISRDGRGTQVVYAQMDDMCDMCQ